MSCILRIAIPYNLVKNGEKTYGMDAHFWTMLDLDARLVLLIRPGNQLTKTIKDYHVLEPNIDAETQINDLSSLRKSLAAWAKRHNRWKLARLLFPAREPRGGWEYMYASRIVEALDIEDYRPAGTAWFALEVHVDGPDRVIVNDKIYAWLLENDKGFRRGLQRITSRFPCPRANPWESVVR